jgi:glycosyltransferase involved in cell wall biosynthesis
MASDRTPPAGPRLDILQVITTIDVGGAEAHVLSLCRGLVAEGHRVHVVYLKGRGTLHAEFSQLGIHPEKIPLERYTQLPACVYRLYRHLERHRYSVVHTHLLKANFTGAIASHLAGNPRIVASKHNDEPQLLHPVVARLHRFSSRLDRTVICASRHILEHVVRRGGVERGKCQTVHYGIDDPSEAAGGSSMRAELRLEDSTAVIACVARLVPRKGHLHLFDALGQVLEQRTDVRLLVVGDGPARDDLERGCRQRGLTQHVLFLGQRLDVPRILRCIDVFVLPSEAEGFGRVILEAMAAGQPVVASRVGGIPEIVVHGETGFLVSPRQPGELAERILALLDDRERAAELGRAGRLRVREHFSMQSMMDQTLAIYRAVAGDG